MIFIRMNIRLHNANASFDLFFFFVKNTGLMNVSGSFADRLGHHQPRGLCCAHVSKHERVGGDMGERRLPRVQLLAKVSHLHLLTLISMITCRRSPGLLGTRVQDRNVENS